MRNSDGTHLLVQGVPAFLDPPKDTAGAAIAALAHHRVAVKILTGAGAVIVKAQPRLDDTLQMRDVAQATNYAICKDRDQSRKNCSNSTRWWRLS